MAPGGRTRVRATLGATPSQDARPGAAQRDRVTDAALPPGGRRSRLLGPLSASGGYFHKTL